MADDKKNDDLDDLLNNALGDFDKTASQNDGTIANAAVNATNGESAEPSDNNTFYEEHAKLLAERMSALFGNLDTPTGDMPPLPQDPDKILSGFQKMAEAAAMTLEGANPAKDDEVSKYADSIAQALKGLQDGADNLSAPASENDVVNMLSSLNLEGAAEGEGNMFLPFMEGMMQSLLSAEILLPSIKELLEKYPKYLEDNAGTLSAEDKERYEKQLELYKIIEEHLENENANDTAAMKREKFRVVLEDMRKLQELGQPPDEILSETAGDLPILDPSMMGAGPGAGANPQCPTM